MLKAMNSTGTELTEHDFQKIIARRDSRYDGRFFFGVRTTKIYCRVSCPARPKPENIQVFKSPSEAERSGYRPCLRCRPDAAPGSEVLNGTGRTVSRALRLIDEARFDRTSIETLAEKLGVTDRHLRRLFETHLGASPIEIIITKRLHTAKQLVTETNRPLSEIAHAVGFQSIRRFNDAFKKLFDRTPSDFRERRLPQTTQNSGTNGAFKLSMVVHEPYDWSTVLKYLGRHEAFGIELVEEDSYTRFLGKGQIEVTRPRGRGPLQVRLIDIDLHEVRSILDRLSRLFDTRHNPAHLPKLRGIKSGGVRVPGSFDGFETAVSIILSQLVSTVRARALLKKLIVRFGRPIESGTLRYTFPSPQDLIAAPLEELGMPRARAEAIRELCRRVTLREIDLSPAADVNVMRDRLLAIKGIGPWTVELVAMRCWCDPNAFPKSDLIVQRALEAELCREADWSSVRAYLTHCLWRDFSNLPPLKGRKKS